ncbi:MAG: hypothetical protein AAFX95_01500 [Cyanobacteria bacterium J06639_16]
MPSIKRPGAIAFFNSSNQSAIAFFNSPQQVTEGDRTELAQSVSRVIAGIDLALSNLSAI